MDGIAVTKAVVSFAVTIGTGKIIAQVIKNNSQPETIVEAITMTCGAFALGGLVAAETSKYANQQIDEIVALYKKHFKKNA